MAQTFTIPGKDSGSGHIVGGQTFVMPGTITGAGRIVPPERTKWAALSDNIIFEAKHSAVELALKPNVANFVEQHLIQGKPRLQKIGVNLQEIKFVGRFHEMILPFNKVKAALLDAAINGTILTWIWGTGEALGDFVIINFEEKVKKTDEVGLIFATEFEITLKEYAGPGVAAQTGIDARKAAFANKKLNAQIPTLAPKRISSISSLSDNITKVQTLNNKITKHLTLLQQAKKSIAAFKRDVLPVISKMKQAVNEINSAVNIARNIKNANSITAAASLVSTAANSLGIALGPGGATLHEISGLSTSVSQSAAALDQAAAASQIVKSWFTPLHI